MTKLCKRFLKRNKWRRFSKCHSFTAHEENSWAGRAYLVSIYDGLLKMKLRHVLIPICTLAHLLEFGHGVLFVLNEENIST